MSFFEQYKRALDRLVGDTSDEEAATVIAPSEPVSPEAVTPVPAPPSPLMARGDLMLDTDAKLKSELAGVPDDRWTQFVRAMITAVPSSVSTSNAVGMFEMMPRRLADLGVVEKLARKRNESGKTVWDAAFVAPLTAELFLKSPEAQYRVFSMSMKDYAKAIADGKLEGSEAVKDGSMSLSGALAILHRCGPQGLKTWQSGERFPTTVAAYERVAGIF